MSSKSEHDQEEVLGSTPHKRVHYNTINPLAKGVPPHIHRPPPRGLGIFTGLAYLGASIVSHTYFPVVQLIGLQMSVLGWIVVQKMLR